MSMGNTLSTLALQIITKNSLKRSFARHRVRQSERAGFGNASHANLAHELLRPRKRVRQSSPQEACRWQFLKRGNTEDKER
jgi:hypothetical protein